MLQNRRRVWYARAISCLLCLCMIFSQGLLPAKAIETCHSVENDSMRIALTFDDGPHPILTHRILDILEKNHVFATFFMVGVNVENYPETAREVIRRGHEVGNHTYSHGHLDRLPESAVESEIWRCEDALEELCEYRPHLFRPPEGAINPFVERCSEENDYTLILWSLDTRDWESKNAERIVDCVLSKIRPGDIILMHDYIGYNSQTPQALEILLPRLLERGFEPVTVSQLLGEQ